MTDRHHQLAINNSLIATVELTSAEISDLVTYLTQVNAHSYVGMLICKGLMDDDNVARYKLQMLRAQNLKNKFSDLEKNFFKK